MTARSCRHPAAALSISEGMDCLEAPGAWFSFAMTTELTVHRTDGLGILRAQSPSGRIEVVFRNPVHDLPPDVPGLSVWHHPRRASTAVADQGVMALSWMPPAVWARAGTACFPGALPPNNQGLALLLGTMDTMLYARGTLEFAVFEAGDDDSQRIFRLPLRR